MCILLKTKKNTPTAIAFEPSSPLLKRMNASKKGEITCWKVYGKWGKLLVSVWQRNKISKAGVIVSNRQEKMQCDSLTSLEMGIGKVYYGIHVYTTRTEAELYCDSYGVVVPVICRKKNLIAEDLNDLSAVFTQVRIEKKTWNKIFPSL